MKKDILILCQFFYPEYVSSATLPFDTAKKLVQFGFSVDVITGYPKEYLRDIRKILRKEKVNGINIQRVKYFSLNRKKKIGRLINYFSFTIRILLKLFSFRKYNFIFVYSNPPLLPYVAYLSNKLFGVKIIFILYDIYPEIALLTDSVKGNSVIHKSMNIINNKVYRVLTRVVVLSNDMKDYVVKNREIDSSKIVLIENWYHKIKIKNSLSINIDDRFYRIKNDSRLKVVYTGNLGIAQDSDLIINLIKANKNNRNISFVVTGHGKRMLDLKNIHDNSNFDNLYIFDFLHENEYEKLLMLTDVFLLSLKKELSGLASPSKLYSYLAAGKPIIALIAKNSYLAEFIVNENIGVVSESQNISELENLILTLKDKNDKYFEMCQNAIDLFSKSYETCIATEKYVNLMNELKEEYIDEK